MSGNLSPDLGVPPPLPPSAAGGRGAGRGVRGGRGRAGAGTPPPPPPPPLRQHPTDGDTTADAAGGLPNPYASSSAGAVSKPSLPRLRPADGARDHRAGAAAPLKGATPAAAHLSAAAAYDAYVASLDYETVVPPPPRTTRERVAACAWAAVCRGALWGMWLTCFPVLLLLHLLLLALDRRQRALWLRHHRAWPFRSVPHVRKTRFTAGSRFPLERWTLVSEDGRQRWVYTEDPAAPASAALRQANHYDEALPPSFPHGTTGPAEAPGPVNRLGVAQACGFSSADDFEEHEQRSPSAPPRRGSPPPPPPFVPALLQDKQRRRAWLSRYQLGLTPENQQTVPQPRATADEALRDGADFLMRLQEPFSGHWPNDYSGCMFLTPGLVFAEFIIRGGDTSRMFAQPPQAGGGSSPAASKGHPHHSSSGSQSAAGDAWASGAPTRQELIRYLLNYQNYDGGWGQHTEGHSTMLGTVLSYVTLRLLGVPASDPQAAMGRQWIEREGGAVLTPMWGRVWLSILGVFDWEGVNPIPPEMILMPDWIPFSEGRAWCHSRVIAIPFSYLYGLRWQAPSHPVLEDIKREIYTESYGAIDWRRWRGAVCEKDLYTPTSGLFRLAMKVLDLYERCPIAPVRRLALERNWQHLAYDDENTHFICLGPVNKSLNMLITWIREGDESPRFRLHQQRVADYLYMTAAGMKMNGYNGSQLWDTSFAVQAICSANLQDAYPEQMALAHHYVGVAQVLEDPIAAAYFYRHRTKGAWNFSTAAQGWQVSDCTAEGLRVLLLLPSLPFPRSRIRDAVDEILSLRNAGGDGGWAPYEDTRAPRYAELLDCAELFKDVMIDYSYVECSSSCIHSLALFRQQDPDYRAADVRLAIREGISYILRTQRPDGSFYGSWAVCFTYGAWFVADALRASGELPDMANHPHCLRLVDFLLLHQNPDGGWGEDVTACARQMWVDNPDGSQVVNTAWAVMAIICASGKSRKTSAARRRRIATAVERGVQLIMSRQLPSGDWAQERISGVFNGNNPIHYPGYKNCMTVWALGKYAAWRKEYVVDA